MRRLGRILRTLLVALLLVAAAVWYFTRPERLPDRVILTGGPIITMAEGEEAPPEAVLVEQGRIRALGRLEDLSAGDVEIYDLEGRALVPGLIEPHTHPLATALLGAAVDISGFTHHSRAEVMQSLHDAAKETALTPWLVAYGWDPVALPDLTPPKLAELDAIAPDRPMVIITQMLHEVFANSAAMQAAGVASTSSTEDVEGIIRDAQGRATGAFRELQAVNKILSAMPAADPAVIELLLRRTYAHYAGAGYTTIGITGAVGRHPDPVGLLRHVGETQAPLRAYLYLLPHQEGALGGNDDFRILGTKFWMDGSPFTGGAAFAEAYENSELTRDRMHIPHGHFGPLNHEGGDFAAEVARLQAAGHQIAVHAQGERALDRVLDAFEAAGPVPGVNHRIEHNALITEAQMHRARELGLSLGFFVDHIYYYGDALEDIVGERRARYMPVRDALRAGLVTTLHGDHPATPMDPLRSLRVAVERKSRSGQVVTAPDQAISRRQALQAMTLHAARQLGQQALIGSIETGKYADFTLLSADPLTAEWEGLEVIGTWKAGQPVNNGWTGWLRPGPLWTAVRGMIF